MQFKTAKDLSPYIGDANKVGNLKFQMPLLFCAISVGLESSLSAFPEQDPVTMLDVNGDNSLRELMPSQFSEYRWVNQ